ncbi:MAG TPA: hypothetical protein VFJ64_07865 [Solirubrobacterales bacterium]|nr:hypothetical protein [Solirubrobacterales bacterium]
MTPPVKPAAAIWASVIAALALLTIAVSTAKAATGFQPLGLSVDGGEESWHAESSFAVRWSNPPSVAAVHYRLLDPSGQVSLAEARIGWAATAIQQLPVPQVPGAYIVEVWLEDSTGNEGDPVAARLRFDDSPPGHVDPLPPGGWISRTAFPLTLRLSRPADPQPLSSIRGYAVSIDLAADGEPCAGAFACSEGETDLRAGIEGNSLAISELPEGTSYVHAVAVSGSGVRSAVAGGATVRVDKTDPVTQLSGYPEGWSNRPLTLTATATDSGSGMTATSDGPTSFTAIRVDGGSPTAAAGDTVATTVIGSGVHKVAYYGRDAAGNVNDGGSSNGWSNRAPATAVVRIDRDAPTLAFSNAQDPADPERIEARASDALSGIDPARGGISVRPVGSTGRFEALPTQASGTAFVAHWDSESAPPGEYEFRAMAFDRAGNSASTSSRSDGAAMRLRGPLKIATTLSAGFQGTPASRAVAFGRGVAYSGHLIAGRHTPLAGMPVRIIERFAAGAEPQERESTVWTGAGGAFRTRLAPGPSREVIAIAPSTPTLQGSHSRISNLAVRGRVHLGVSSRVAEVSGKPIVFHGKVASAGTETPADGRAVQLQFRLPGLTWSEFRTIRTDQRGRFRYAYRFADDDSRGVHFQFRAFVPAQAGWPFEPAGSLRVAVLGR